MTIYFYYSILFLVFFYFNIMCFYFVKLLGTLYNDSFSLFFINFFTFYWFFSFISVLIEILHKKKKHLLYIRLSFHATYYFSIVCLNVYFIIKSLYIYICVKYIMITDFSFLTMIYFNLQFLLKIIMMSATTLQNFKYMVYL